MKGGMGQGAGIPLKDRRGPTHTKPVTHCSGTDEVAPGGVGPAQPPGTPCWLDLGEHRVAGVLLGWQQDEGHGWHALVSCWLPAKLLARRGPEPAELSGS